MAAETFVKGTPQVPPRGPNRVLRDQFTTLAAFILFGHPLMDKGRIRMTLALSSQSDVSFSQDYSESWMDMDNHDGRREGQGLSSQLPQTSNGGPHFQLLGMPLSPHAPAPQVLDCEQRILACMVRMVRWECARACVTALIMTPLIGYFAQLSWATLAGYLLGSFATSLSIGLLTRDACRLNWRESGPTDY